jgi:hypothetical protein
MNSLMATESLKGCQMTRNQRNYRKVATFPDLENENLPILFQCLIYACWSAEFGRYIALGKFRQHIDDNPARFAF